MILQCLHMGQILQRYLKQLWQLASLGKTAFCQQGLGYQYISSGEKAMEGISIRQKLILGALFPKSTIKPQLPQPQVTVTLGAF